MSSVFSRKIIIFTFSGCFTGEGTPLKYWIGRKQTKRSRSCRSATLSERMPPPTGVVSGPLIPTRYSRNASTVSFGNHSSNLSFAVSPAKTSNHAIFFFPPYAFSTAASNTRTLAAQISGPVPSPRMNGMIGRSGTFNLSVLVIFSPAGGATFLYGIRGNCSGSRAGCNLAEVVRSWRPREGLSLGRPNEAEAVFFCCPLLPAAWRLFGRNRRRKLWSERSDNERLHKLICRRTFWSHNFLAFIFFKIFSVFAVTGVPHSPRRVRRSSDPVCQIRTGSYRSGNKRANLARRITNKHRIESLHKLLGRGGGDAGRSRCSNRAIQIAIRGHNLTLTLNCLLNQSRTGQWAKTADQR